MKKSVPPATPVTDRPLVTVDVAIFSVMAGQLRVLLVRRPEGADEPFAGRWALPGGFVDVHRDADLLACALRKLKEKTGVSSPYLEQLGSWGDARRDPRGWSATHAYFALIPAPAETDRIAGTVAFEWVQADEARRRRLAFDHSQILASAIERLLAKAEYTSLPAFLCPEPFTLPELQRVYEVVLGRELDKSAFRRRMLDAGFLEETGQVSGTSGRAAMGYRILERERPAVFPRTFRSGE